ncbi:uncharacterized protein LAESUDRAFT_616672, partial [Laetiporus sulphureus 93-53]
KQEKALLMQIMFDKIWDILHDPATSRVRMPQFFWWVQKILWLALICKIISRAQPNVLEKQICDILCYCHCLSNHGGMDKTMSLICEHHSWISKKLISQFVKN